MRPINKKSCSQFKKKKKTHKEIPNQKQIPNPTNPPSQTLNTIVEKSRFNTNHGGCGSRRLSFVGYSDGMKEKRGLR